MEVKVKVEEEGEVQGEEVKELGWHKLFNEIGLSCHNNHATS